MSPLSAIPSTMSGAMPQFDMVTSELTPLSPTSVDQPLEISSVTPAGDSFSSMLGKMVADVNAQQASAGQSVAALQGGQNVPLHQAVIAMEEANVSFQLMVEVRNRLMDAYQEIMRMQV